MSACAGSLTDASRSVWLRCGPKGLALGYTGNVPELLPGIVFGRKRGSFKYFAGMVPMDRARQDWVYEYAETGRPLAARSLQRSRGEFGGRIPWFAGARILCNSRWSNGPAGKSGPDGHKLSVIGSPQPAARSACFHRPPHWFAACWEDLDTEAIPWASPGLSVHPFLRRSCAPHSTLPRLPTAISCRTERHDGKRNLHFQHAA
jgi:hypothetical protein